MSHIRCPAPEGGGDLRALRTRVNTSETTKRPQFGQRCFECYLFYLLADLFGVSFFLSGLFIYLSL